MLKDKTIGKPVFVYDWVTGGLIFLYNSINASVQQMNLLASTVVMRCTDNLVLNGKYVLSFIPLTAEQVKNALPIRTFPILVNNLI